MFYKQNKCFRNITSVQKCFKMKTYHLKNKTKCFSLISTKCLNPKNPKLLKSNSRKFKNREKTKLF